MSDMPIAPQPGVLFTGTYRTTNADPGRPGGPSVFDTLAFPPQAGANAETQAREDLGDLGTVDPPAVIETYLYRNSDPFKNTHDDAGIPKAPFTT